MIRRFYCWDFFVGVFVKEIIQCNFLMLIDKLASAKVISRVLLFFHKHMNYKIKVKAAFMMYYALDLFNQYHIMNSIYHFLPMNMLAA